MIQRTIFSPEHEAFRDSFRRLIEKEIAPFHAEWEEQGYVDRAVWSKAGENGFLRPTMPEEYGGTNEITKEVITRAMGLGGKGAPRSAHLSPARAGAPISGRPRARPGRPRNQLAPASAG